ncbi:MAG TPA: hypothetical protein VIX41_09860, partial [Acidimicrobiales bacterium]
MAPVGLAVVLLGIGREAAALAPALTWFGGRVIFSGATAAFGRLALGDALLGGATVARHCHSVAPPAAS